MFGHDGFPTTRHIDDGLPAIDPPATFTRNLPPRYCRVVHPGAVVTAGSALPDNGKEQLINRPKPAIGSR